MAIGALWYFQRTLTNRPDPAAALGDYRPSAVPADLESLNELLLEIRQEHQIPALAAAVGRSAGPLAAGAVGARKAGNPMPVELADRFHLGSCTKAMTATLLALQIQEGRLGWDEPLEEIFPNLSRSFHRDFRPVTLSQFLLHRGGLPGDRKPDLGRMQMLWSLSGPLPDQRRTALKNLLAVAPATPPDNRFEYSNVGYLVAGTAAEKVAGSSWENLMRERIFEPLGMDGAGFGAPGRPGALPDEPWGHRSILGAAVPVEPGVRADNPAVLGPAGTVHAPILDFLRWGLLHLRGARRLADPAIELPPAVFAKLHGDPYGQEYGYGWGVSRDEQGRRVLSHAGSNTAFFAFIRLLPEQDLALVVATNSGQRSAADAGKKTLDRLTEEWAAKAATPDGV